MMRMGLGIQMLSIYAKIAEFCGIFTLLICSTAYPARSEASLVVAATPQETWVEDQLGKTLSVDLNSYCGKPIDFDKAEKSHDDCHMVRASFLIPRLTLLQRAAELKLLGMYIVGDLDFRRARFAYPLIVSDTDISGRVDFEEAIFDKDMTLDHVKVASAFFASRTVMNDSFYIKNHTFLNGDLDFQNSHIKGDFQIKDSAFERKVDISRDSIDGDLEVNDCEINGSLVADRAHISGDAALRRSTLKGTLNLVGARTEGDLTLAKLDVEGATSGYNARVDGTLQIDAGTSFNKKMEVIGLNVGRNFKIGNSLFREGLNMGLGHVAQGLFIHDAVFNQPIDLVGASIGTHLDIAGSTLTGLDLTRANINGDFRVASQKWNLRPNWAPGSKLSLRYARLSIIQDDNTNQAVAYWPEKIDMEGLVFEHFGSHRDWHWVSQWLKKDVSGSLQPYQQMAAMYKSNGDFDNSDGLLYESKDRELAGRWKECRISNLSACVGTFGLFTSKWLIGYGIGSGFDFAFYWIFALVLFGAIVLSFAKTPRGRIWRVGASANKLIPVLDLSKEFKDYFDDNKTNLHGWQFVYFCFHATMGYVLAFLAGAAFAGLTQAH